MPRVNRPKPSEPTDSSASADDRTRFPSSDPSGDADDRTRFPSSDPSASADDRTRFPSSDHDRQTILPAAQTVLPGAGPVAAAGTATPLPPTEHYAGEGLIEVGEPFGTRYRIIRLLGIGGMGAVYHAWDAELGVSVALKVVRREITDDPVAARDIERRFKRELLLARQVTHPNVVRIHDLGEVNGVKYITMAFIDGADLASVLNQEKKLSVPRALRAARGIVAGLVAAHQAGVVHRDLKPANIMIEADDAPTIMDFGIARSSGGGPNATPATVTAPARLTREEVLAASGTIAGAIVGTVAYMAPEQARGEVADQRADIYAFGLILYDMLIGGRRSERAASAIAELQGRMQTAPPPPRSIDPEIPEAVDAIIRRCLEPDPAKRFQTTVELQHALDRLDENGKPLPIMRRLTRRTMAAAAVVVAVLLAGTFYVANWLATPLPEPAPVSVLIADFLNNTSDPTFDNTLGQTVRRALEDASFISAYDRSRLPTLGVRAPEKLDEVVARELAVKQGLGVVLAGAIDPSGSGYEISARALHAVTGEVIANVRNSAASKDRVLETATRLMATVRKMLGDNKSESAQLFAMRSISASSLEVVSLYAAAVEAQSKGQIEEAKQHFLKAVELDPSFGLGYQGLAAMLRNQFRLPEAEKYSKQALQYLDGMTERERFATRAFYYTMTNDFPQCVKEYGELLARYPADSVAHSQRAVCLRRMRKMREAVEEMQQAVQMLPNHVGFRINLALIANYAGEFDLVEREVNSLETKDPRVLIALVYSQLGRGLLQEAAQTYAKLRPIDARMASFAATGLGDIAVYEGRYADAVKIFEEGAAADLEAKSPDRAAIKFTSMAYAHLRAGQKALAAAAAEKALAHGQSVSARFLAARSLVEVGEIEKARKLAAAIPSPSDLSGESPTYGKIIEAEIAIKEGNPNQAIKILTDANTVLDTWFGRFALGRAHFEAGQFVQADSAFDLCITRRGEALSLTDDGPSYGYFPIVYYYQGRIREELKTAGFAEPYREYLRIRGASSEDPLVPEIRKRVGN